MKIILLLCLSLLLACSTKKPSQKTEAPDIGSGQESLVMNGSSDDRKAGALRTVRFDYLSDSLTKDAKNTLESNVKYLMSNPSLTVQVEGHCDERGGAQYNLALGERRAKVVRDYLRAKGVQAKRITIISYGKERPLDFGDSEQVRAKNRRASFVITAM